MVVKQLLAAKDKVSDGVVVKQFLAAKVSDGVVVKQSLAAKVSDGRL